MTQTVAPTSSLQPYLQFQLTPEHLGMLPTDQLVEIITLTPEQVIPIPEMPPHVLGVYNWRGEIIWILDSLLSPAPSTPIKHAILLRCKMPQQDGAVVGLVVQHVHQMIWCNPDAIEPPPSTIAAHPIDRLRRWVTPQQETIYCFDPSIALT
jgi:positive phototaxis protein PixI